MYKISLPRLSESEYKSSPNAPTHLPQIPPPPPSHVPQIRDPHAILHVTDRTAGRITDVRALAVHSSAGIQRVLKMASPRQNSCLNRKYYDRLQVHERFRLNLESIINKVFFFSFVVTYVVAFMTTNLISKLGINS